MPPHCACVSGNFPIVRHRFRGTAAAPCQAAATARSRLAQSAGRGIPSAGLRQRKGGCSLESANDPRLTIGLGRVEEVASLVVRWPSGGPDTVLDNLKADRTYDVIEPKAGP